MADIALLGPRYPTYSPINKTSTEADSYSAAEITQQTISAPSPGIQYPTYTSIGKLSTELNSFGAAEIKTIISSIAPVGLQIPTVLSISRTSTFILTSGEPVTTQGAAPPTQSWYFS